MYKQVFVYYIYLQPSNLDFFKQHRRNKLKMIISIETVF